MASDDLAGRWACTAVLLGADEPAALATGRRLAEQYERPVRSYHTAEHAGRVADAADDLAQGLRLAPLERHTLIAAALAHDVVYDSQPGRDELASAQLAEQALRDAHVDGDAAAEVARLIRTTATHRVEVEDRAGAALADADLSILGSAPADYEAYAVAVRKEYAHVFDEDWRVGRAAVLSDLLGRPSLFVTEPARRRWEVQARVNMAAELRSLAAR